MRKTLGCICVLAWFGLAFCLGGAQAAKKKTPLKSGASKSTKKAPSKKAGASSKAGKKSTAKGGKKGSVRTTWRNRQLTPTPERYKEIQNALAGKGYLAPEEATGVWGPGSVDALKRFQADQRLDGNGKINSLSLIALGLGPKREPLPASDKPPDPAAQPLSR